MLKLGLTKRYTVYEEQQMSGKEAISPTHFLFSVDLMLLSQIDLNSFMSLFILDQFDKGQGENC